MKLRHLATAATVTGALLVPASSASAAPVPPPGPVLICGATVSECVYWATHLFTVSCGPVLRPVCDILPAKD